MVGRYVDGWLVGRWMVDDWVVGRWMDECVAGLGTLVLLLGRERWRDWGGLWRETESCGLWGGGGAGAGAEKHLVKMMKSLGAVLPRAMNLTKSVPFHNDLDSLLGEWSSAGEAFLWLTSVSFGIIFCELVRSSLSLNPTMGLHMAKYNISLVFFFPCVSVHLRWRTFFCVFHVWNNIPFCDCRQPFCLVELYSITFHIFLQPKMSSQVGL